MQRVQRVDEELRGLMKPALEPAEGIVLREDDSLILCAGFEERAVESLRRFVVCGCSGFLAIVVTYKPHIAANRLGEIRELCAKADATVVEVPYDRENPVGAGEALVHAVGKRQGRILLDVSGMSRLLIVQALVAFGESGQGIGQVCIVYTEAKEYPPSREEVQRALATAGPGTIYELVFLSSGVFGVIIVPELSSVALHGRPVRLVAFPSFNPDQLAMLRSELQPSYFTLVHGLPHLKENAWRRDAIKVLNATEQIPRREDFEASTLDYRQVLDLLLYIYATHGASERIVIAPTGSKMQAVAVGLFRLFMGDVQIAYPPPRAYPCPEEYTRGVLAVYRLPLDAFASV